MSLVFQHDAGPVPLTSFTSPNQERTRPCVGSPVSISVSGTLLDDVIAAFLTYDHLVHYVCFSVRISPRLSNDDSLL